jgi:hypothetical protein
LSPALLLALAKHPDLITLAASWEALPQVKRDCILNIVREAWANSQEAG